MCTKFMTVPRERPSLVSSPYALRAPYRLHPRKSTRNSKSLAGFADFNLTNQEAGYNTHRHSAVLDYIHA